MKMFALQYCDHGENYWSNHTFYKSIREARSVRKEIVEDERMRKTGSRWRIVLFEGRIYDKEIS